MCEVFWFSSSVCWLELRAQAWVKNLLGPRGPNEGHEGRAQVGMCKSFLKVVQQYQIHPCVIGAPGLL